MRIFISALIFAVVVYNSIVFAEDPPVERWVARYNRGGASLDATPAIAIDNYGNVYITGETTDPNTLCNYVTIRYDSNGSQKWAACYDGPGNGHDITHAIATDTSGNIYVTGQSEGNDTNYDYATIKYDSNGNQIWVARYNGQGNSYDWSNAIAVDQSGNVYVTGLSVGSVTNGDYATIKYDSNGNQIWVACYNDSGNNHDEATAITLDNCGNVYVTGSSTSSDSDEYTTIKYDPNGNQMWIAHYKGVGNNWNIATAIATDNQSNVYVTGLSPGSGTERDYATIKYDSNGNQKWVSRYNGPGNSDDIAIAIAVGNSGNVYVTGGSYSGDYTGFGYATIKYDSNGNQKWVARYNGGNSYEIAIAIDNHDNVYVTGPSSQDGNYATVKYDSNGNQLWVACYNGNVGIVDAASAIATDNRGNVYVTCKGMDIESGWNYATIKYTQHDICLGEIEGDLNNDCKVDFVDFAILASHWLECKYAYEGDCL